MHRTSRSASTSVKPVDINIQTREQESPLTRTELRIQLQDCARRKDWSALQNILTAYPDTYQPEGPGETHPVLELDLADTRELGDLAEHLPPDAHLPVLVVRGADLRAPDQRIAQLTAHRHSFGLRLENCQIGKDGVDVLTRGAQQGHAAGYPGLRVLGCTHAQAVSADSLFSVSLEDDERDIHRSQCGLLDIGIQDLIQASPHLEAFALTGLIPIEARPDEDGPRYQNGVIDLQPVFSALARTPLRQLHLDNCCSLNLNQNADTDDGWLTWACSTSVSIQHLELTRWCTESDSAGIEERLTFMLGGAGISHPDHGPIRLECADVAEASPASHALGTALRQRNAEVQVQWECWGTPHPEILSFTKENGKDNGWYTFHRTLLSSGYSTSDDFQAPLSVKLIRPHTIDLISMSEAMQQFKDVRALTLVGNQRIDHKAADSPELVRDREQRVMAFLQDLEQQPQLIELDLGHLLDNLALERRLAGATIRGPQSHLPLGAYTDQQLSDRYRALKTRIEREARRDKIASRMASHGLDLGEGGRLIADVSSVIARQLQGNRGELGESLLSVALTNQANQAAWAAASHEV